MKKLVENICSEFADNYDISEDMGSLVVSVETEIEDLGDLSSVFEGYGFELREIGEVSGGTTRCKAIFLQTEVPASEGS